MKYRLLSLLFFCLCYTGQSQIYTENFNNSSNLHDTYFLKNVGGVTYGFFTVGADYVANATPNSLPISIVPTGHDGSKVVAVEDMDGAGFSTQMTIETESIDISSYTSLSISLKVASTNATTTRYEASDGIDVQYALDGSSSWVTVGDFKGRRSDNLSFLYEDSDLNGSYETLTGSAMRTVSYDLDARAGSTVSGNSIKLRVVFTSEGAQEEMMIDDLELYGTLSAVPEIDISGNGSNISNGDGTPSSTDHTDFGSETVSSGSITRTFTIDNNGTGTLNLNGSPIVSLSGHTSDFTVLTQAAGVVAAGGATTFQIEFDPTEVGTRSAVVSIENDDSDEDPFTFSIEGTGTCSSGNDLATLSLSGLTLSPSFSVATTSYTASTSYSVVSTTIAATSDDVDASVSGDGLQALSYGDNNYQIVVTSGCGVDQTYEITVNRSKPNVVINEVVSDPQRDWSSVGFEAGSTPGGEGGADDEWVELYINEDDLDLSLWGIELNDGTDVSGDLTNTGAFDVVNYVSEDGGGLSSTKAGDYVILGNVDGDGAINNTSLTIVLRDENGDVIDRVSLGGGSEEAPSGAASYKGDESIARIVNGQNTGSNDVDFLQVIATIGTANRSLNASGIRGSAIVFDGDNDYVKLSDLESYNVESFTMETWVKTDNSSNGGMIFTKKANSTDKNCALGLQSSGEAYVAFDDDASTEYTTIGTSNLEDGEWHYIVGVFDAVNDELIIYVDGVEEASTSPGAVPATGTSDLYVGSESSSLSMFEGTIDEVALWNVVKSESEIRESKHMTYEGSENGLVLYLQFNEASGSAFDVVFGNEGEFNGDVDREDSGANVAKGVSETHTITSTGFYETWSTLSNYAFSLRFTSSHPNGDVVVSFLPDDPVGGVVSESGNNSPGVWVVDNYGAVQESLAATVRFRYPNSSISTFSFSSFKLYKRGSNSVAAWGGYVRISTGISTYPSNNYVEFSSINSFSQFVMVSEISPLFTYEPLSVDLVSFEGEVVAGEVLLRWETATEKENDYFVIERSFDTGSFEAIGEIDAVGDSQELVSYSLVDNSPLSGIGYYRLKSIDIHGEEDYSKIIAIHNERSFSIMLSPNPFSNVINLNLAIEEVGDFQIQIYDRYGNKQMEDVLKGEIGLERKVIDTEMLIPGVYFFRLIYNGHPYVYNLVKK